MFPPTVFQNVILAVGLAAIYNSLQAFIPSIRLTHRIYARKPKQATPLAARMMGNWTLTSAFIRIYAAYHIHNPAMYQLCMFTYAIALVSFSTEIVYHKTAPWNSPGVLPAMIISSSMLSYMLFNYSYYVQQ